MSSYTQFFNGEGRSNEDQNGFDATSNLDVHSISGIAQAQFALASESTTPNEACVQATASDGTMYFFSTASGKIWKRTTGGTYSLVRTNANGAHINAFYSPTLNKIIYVTSTKVGHLVSSTDIFSDSFGTFSNGSSYHPMVEVNQSVFIGDGKYIAAISSSLSFSANALDIPASESVTALKDENNWLLIGTIVGANVNRCMTYLWDTYSSSWSIDDPMPEPGINCFIEGDNVTYCQAGVNGNIYYWNGARMVFFYQIRNVTTSHGHQKTTMLAGKPLLAVSTTIYSIWKRLGERDVVVSEYTITTGTIASIGVSGTNLFVSTGSNIDKTSTNRATAKITTPLITDDTTDVYVSYRSLNGGSLSLESNVNGAGWVSETGFTNDSIENRYALDNGLTYDGSVNYYQLRVTLTPSGSSTPIIKEILTQ